MPDFDYYPSGAVAFSGAAFPPVDPTIRGLLTIGDVDAQQSLVLTNQHDGTVTGFGVVASHTDGTVTKEATGVLPNPNEWYHVTMTRDATSIKLFVDGNLVKTIPLTGKLAKLGTLPKAQVGRLLQQYFAGRVDDVRVYRRVLDEDEVAGLVSGLEPKTAIFSLTSDFIYDASGRLLVLGGGPVSQSSYVYEGKGRLLLYVPRLFLWWQLDEESGSLAYDSSAYAHTGTLFNMEPDDWVDAGIPGFRFGNRSALRFDGQDEYVESLLSDLSDLDEGFTLSVWVNLDELPVP